MFNLKGDEEKVQKAFIKVKEDIFYLGNEFNSLKQELMEIKEMLKSLNNDINNLKIQGITQKAYPTHQQITPTHPNTPADNPTVPQELRGLKYPDFHSSIGNEGVPTDRQTDQQTDNPTDFSLKKSLNEASEILSSIDSLRKGIRLKFKQMTQQEMLVFSTIFQLEEQQGEGVKYSQIASKLKLSPSSIRDYVQRIISKGIPIIKTKVNNKKILLSVSSELKRIASLETIIRLREL